MVQELALTIVHGFVKAHKVYKLDSIIIIKIICYLVGVKNPNVSTKDTQSQIKAFHQKKINSLTT